MANSKEAVEFWKRYPKLRPCPSNSRKRVAELNEVLFCDCTSRELSQVTKRTYVVEPDVATAKEWQDHLTVFINTLLRPLSYRDASVIRFHFGMFKDGGPARTFVEIGEIIGCTAENVRRIELRIIRKIQKNSSAWLHYERIENGRLHRTKNRRHDFYVWLSARSISSY